jgi:D-amino-acid dehydrogenase
MVGWNRKIPDRAVNELAGGFATTSPRIGNLSHTERLSSWPDFHPTTPTGVSIAESSSLRNLYLNGGLDNLGWTPVCCSAALLAQQIGGSRTAIDMMSFHFRR